MKKLSFVILLTGAALAAPASYSATGGQATFEHKVGPVLVRGDIAGVTARVRLDTADLAATTGAVTVPLNNLKTGIALRDSHAKGESALHTVKFPNATFQLEKLTGGTLKEGQTVATTASGKLTVKGVTKTLNVPVKATLRGGKVQVGTQFKFNPHDFGVSYTGSSDSVTVNVAFSLTK